MKTPGIGIKGLGVYLPEERRPNSFWSPSVVSKFNQRPDEDLGKVLSRPDGASPIVQIVHEEMDKWQADPFHGAVERRVAPKDAWSSDLEYEAAKAAIADAHLTPADIDIVMVLSLIRDQPLSPNPVKLHRRLGLPSNCPAMATDETCAGFLFQIQLAASYLHTSGARNALLVQSAMFSRILDYNMPLSTTLGDAASAVVLGRLSSQDRGLMALQGFTNGDYHKVAVIDGPPGHRWYEGGVPIRLGTHDKERIKSIPYVAAECARDSVEKALEEAAVSKDEISFFTSHQPTKSFVNICRRAAGLDKAVGYDSFSSVGAVGGCVIPINLAMARNEGLLRNDGLSVLFSTGAGFSWSAAVLRWGD